MNQQPKTWWGAVLTFIKTFFAVATDATNVIEEAVSMADIQVSCVSQKMEEDIALELASYHDQAVQRHALSNAQSAQALVDFTTKNPNMAGFVKTECERLDKAVELYRARRAARRQGVIPTA